MAREQDYNEVERQLRGYFDAQREELKAPADMWSRISGELGEQTPTSWWHRIDVSSWLRTVQPVYAGAAMIAVVAVGVVTYASFSGDSTSDDTATTAAAIQTESVAPQAAAAPLAPGEPEMSSLGVAKAGDGAADTSAASGAPEPAMSLAAEAPVESTDSRVALAFGEPQVFLEPLIDVMLSGQRLFSISLPPDWAIGGPRTATTGWEGTLVRLDDGFFLSYQGGTSTVGDISDVVGSNGDKHVISEELIGGFSAQLVQPIGDEEGVTAMLLQLSEGRMLVIGQNLNAEQQQIAFAIFRSIQG
jgi:hypothetical protein